MADDYKEAIDNDEPESNQQPDSVLRMLENITDQLQGLTKDVGAISNKLGQLLAARTPAKKKAKKKARR